MNGRISEKKENESELEKRSEKVRGMKRRFTEKEVADLYGISLSKIRQDRILKKGLPYIKIGKTVRYREEDLEQAEEMNFYCPVNKSHPVNKRV